MLAINATDLSNIRPVGGNAIRTVIVLGLDGLEPTIVERLLEAGELPHLASLRRQGGYTRVATTYPAQTPVAWSSFATGTNPGGHGIFDFIRRDPTTYRPELGLCRYVERRAFLPPKAENLRRGMPLWARLSQAGVPSAVLRCPCTFPAQPLRGRMLSGMGVPDVRGGFGTPTFYTSGEAVETRESEEVVDVRLRADGAADTVLIGPRHPTTGADVTVPLRLEVDAAERVVRIHSDGRPRTLEVRQGQWSDWLRVKFRVGILQSITGVVRFHLVQLEPLLALYASPLNFDPRVPVFPISAPWDYAGELAAELGMFYTAGMVEDHTGLNNGRIDEAAFLDQCESVLAERERMMTYELERLDGGFFYCLYDTPDRVQHMFWRFREPEHPANVGTMSAEWCGVIDDHYQRCDAIVGRALDFADDRTLVIVLSDHGFGSFQRQFNVNTWLYQNGFLALKKGARPGDTAGDLLQGVDWSRTKAYGLGFAGIYLNLDGREAEGIVSREAAAEVTAAIVGGLTGLRDPSRGRPAIRSVMRREDVYSGAYAEESPDLVINFAGGYRTSSHSALGGVSEQGFEDNVQRWSGDHVLDPELVPGVLFLNRPFDAHGVRLVDMAPTILDALGVEPGPEMEGRSVRP